jgi:hypothetical protein
MAQPTTTNHFNRPLPEPASITQTTIMLPAPVEE